MKRKAGGQLPTLAEGDLVWLEGSHLPTAYPTLKLAPRRHGPFRIIWKLSLVTFQLELPPSMRIHDVFHVSRLLPYRETREHGENFPRPPPDLIEGEEEYEVESIQNSRFFRRQLQYLVKW